MASFHNSILNATIFYSWTPLWIETFKLGSRLHYIYNGYRQRHSHQSPPVANTL